MRKLTLFTFAAGILISAAIIVHSGCTKEGPSGTDGKDANETCKLCHTATVVDKVAAEFDMSKHATGVVAEEETGVAGCAPCHESEGFKYVCTNNIPSTFTLNATTGKYVNDYSATTGTSYGSISCFTCHSSLHTTYGYSDVSSLTTTAAVDMTMWGGAKTINLTQDDGKSNLCIKCHQPRPMAVSAGNGRVLNYDSLHIAPLTVFWDSTSGVTAKYIKPSFRMHVHYGAVGAIVAGIGGVEFPGTLSYTSSDHATKASCQDCHMAPMSNDAVAGGHTYRAKGNFTGCNVAGCHADSPLDASSPKFVNARTATKGLLDQLAAKINACGAGTDILHIDAANLWADGTTNHYDGYLDIFDPSSNPSGYWRNPSPASTWSPADKAANLAKPKFPSLLNVQVGSLINFQMCLREFSQGVHNNSYSTALLTNSIGAMTAAGF